MGSLSLDLLAVASLKIKQRKTGEVNSPCWIGKLGFVCLVFHIGLGGRGVNIKTFS